MVTDNSWATPQVLCGTATMSEALLSDESRAAAVPAAQDRAAHPTIVGSKSLELETAIGYVRRHVFFQIVSWIPPQKGVISPWIAAANAAQQLKNGAIDVIFGTSPKRHIRRPC